QRLLRCLSTLLPPPTSTPFPSTTLFRSRDAGLEALTTRQCRRIERAATWFLARSPRAAATRHIRFDLVVVAPLRLPIHIANAWTDRKSTRLNSSHVKISYAVFCLKKKNK